MTLGCGLPVDDSTAGDTTDTSTAALTIPPANAGFTGGVYQVKNDYGNYCMEAVSDKIYGRACSKTVAAQKWAAYLMPDGLYFLCKSDTLSLKYSYLVLDGTTYDGYFATCLTDSARTQQVLLSNRPVGQNFTAVPGHIDVHSDGHAISVTAFRGAEALRLRTDNFRVDWSGDKANNNYAWATSPW